MTRTLLPLLAAAAVCGCSAGAEENAAAAAEANAAAGPAQSDLQAPAVERPADAPPSGIDDVMGAVPGPCGSEKAAAYMGRAYSPAVAAELEEVTGAGQVAVVDTSGGDADRPSDPRRLNVLLNSRNEIILLDCG